MGKCACLFCQMGSEDTGKPDGPSCLPRSVGKIFLWPGGWQCTQGLSWLEGAPSPALYLQGQGGVIQDDVPLHHHLRLIRGLAYGCDPDHVIRLQVLLILGVRDLHGILRFWKEKPGSRVRGSGFTSETSIACLQCGGDRPLYLLVNNEAQRGRRTYRATQKVGDSIRLLGLLYLPPPHSPLYFAASCRSMVF